MVKGTEDQAFPETEINMDLVKNFQEEIYSEIEDKFKKHEEFKKNVTECKIDNNGNDDEDDVETRTHYVELNPNLLAKNYRSSFNMIIPSNNDVTHLWISIVSLTVFKYRLSRIKCILQISTEIDVYL